MVLILGKGLKRTSVKRKLASVKALLMDGPRRRVTEGVAKSVDAPKVETKGGKRTADERKQNWHFHSDHLYSSISSLYSTGNSTCRVRTMP
jgi:hypothetical protein